jgi:hypothetical protein
MAITKEQFLIGVKEMVADAKDPNGELADLRTEFKSLYDDMAPHDAEMATRLHEVIDAMERFATYVVARGEG